MQTINRRRAGRFAKTEAAAAKGQEAGAPGGVSTKADFGHPMPRLMDYFRGKSMVPEVESAREGGGSEED